MRNKNFVAKGALGPFTSLYTGPGPGKGGAEWFVSPQMHQMSTWKLIGRKFE